MTDTPKPIHTIRLGTVQAAIWSNAGQHGPFYNVTFERRYRDAKEEWQSSASFGRDDLLLLAKIADEAHSFIFNRQASERNGNEQGPSAPVPVAAQAASAADARRRSR
jgi:hypothetical protein